MMVWIACIACIACVAGCGAKSDSGATGGAAPAPDAGSSAALTPPVPHDTTTVASLELGERVFKLRCVLCHGPEGRGNGPGAPALKPNPPRNFHDAAYMHSRTDEQLLVSIHNGKNAMPPWKSILSEVEMKSVLMFVRQFAGKP